MKLVGWMAAAGVAAALAGEAAACSLVMDAPWRPSFPADFSQAEMQAARRAFGPKLSAAKEIERRASALERQRTLKAEATSIFLARVERVDLEGRDGSHEVWLKPQRFLKGRTSGAAFWISYTGMTSCGPYPVYDALSGKAGDVFVVFVKGGAPTRDTVTEAMRPAAVIEPELAALLAALGR